MQAKQKKQFGKISLKTKIKLKLLESVNLETILIHSVRLQILRWGLGLLRFQPLLISGQLLIAIVDQERWTEGCNITKGPGSQVAHCHSSPNSIPQTRSKLMNQGNTLWF